MVALITVFVVMVAISAVVGLITQLLNKLNEASGPPARRPVPPRRAEATPARPDRDMDRFLAEIDRLRKKNTEAAAEPSAQSPPPPPPTTRQGGQRPTAAPVARPGASPPRSRRPVAEPAPPPPTRSRSRVDGSGFATPHAAPQPQTAPLTAPQPTRVEDLPLATVVTPTSSTGAPATRVTHLPQRARAAPKTDLAKNLTGLLNSGQGIAMAVILQEILGPPKSRGGKG